MKLPGSRKDIIRTQTLSGPSPVGGSAGGREGRVVQTLDEFELQAAHYNIACASARLGNIAEVRVGRRRRRRTNFDQKKRKIYLLTVFVFLFQIFFSFFYEYFVFSII